MDRGRRQHYTSLVGDRRAYVEQGFQGTQRAPDGRGLGYMRFVLILFVTGTEFKNEEDVYDRFHCSQIRFIISEGRGDDKENLFTHFYPRCQHWVWSWQLFRLRKISYLSSSLLSGTES